MKGLSGKKTTALILGGLSFLFLFLLVASLGHVQFKPARPFAYEQTSEPAPPVEAPTWNGLEYVIFLMVGVLIVLFLLLPPEQRKKYLIIFTLLGMAMLLTMLIISRIGFGKSVPQLQENAGNAIISPVPGPTNTPAAEITPAVFNPPLVSGWSAYFVALALILVLAGIVGWLVWPRRKPTPPYEGLADIARSALEDIQGGKDWGDTVLNSYHRMNVAVAEWRGIHRKASMTPAEFSQYLASTQLPSEAIGHLTLLFERVRYGEKEASPEGILEAVECLTTILDYCQKAK